MKLWEHDPSEKSDYQVTVENDTIASATATITPTGPTLGAVTTTSTTATVRVSGVVLGTRYTLTIHVVGASGREKDRSCLIQGASQ